MIVKVCGLTREADVIQAVEAGADMLGLNLWPGSPRHVERARAGDLARVARAVRDDVTIIGVLVDPDDEALAEALADDALDAIQVHGPTPAAALARLGDRVIPAVALDGDDALAAITASLAAVVLVDTPSAARGGSGRTGDWALARRAVAAAAARGGCVYLAGGLTPANVAAAIAAVGPAGVDVASGVESAPGVKDAAKVAAFIAAARAAGRGAP